MFIDITKVGAEFVVQQFLIDDIFGIVLIPKGKGDKLFYYTWPKDDTHNYEIDFLLSRGNKLVPIEVKSSGYKTHASLDAFCKKYSSRIDHPLMIYTKDLQNDENTLLLPVYMTMLV